MFDPHVVKKDFPIFSTLLASGKPLVYLDSAATSQKPQAVLDALVHYYTHDNANVHRGIHELGDRSTRAWHTSRHTVAHFLGADPEELVVVRNTTEALNQFALSWLDNHLSEGKIILTTQMEHHSNFLPWQNMAKKWKAQFKLVPVRDDGTLDMQVFDRHLEEFGSNIVLIALAHVSNTLGTLNPVTDMAEKITALRQQNKAFTPLLVVDGAQAAPHLKVDFHTLGADVYAVSAHKMLGPMGVGGLLVRKDVLEQTPPLFVGGGMIGEVYEDHFTYANDLEDVFTPGTPDVAGMVGWAAACTYLSSLGMEQVRKHDQELVEYTLKKLTQISQVKIVGPREVRVGSVAFIYEGVHAHDVAQVLSSEGIAVRSGHHCTMPLHARMGWVATTRVSFNVYTTKEDIDALVRALAKVKQIFGI